jgi:hypothetical protein
MLELKKTNNSILYDQNIPGRPNLFSNNNYLCTIFISKSIDPIEPISKISHRIWRWGFDKHFGKGILMPYIKIQDQVFNKFNLLIQPQTST